MDMVEKYDVRMILEIVKVAMPIIVFLSGRVSVYFLNDKKITYLIKENDSIFEKKWKNLKYSNNVGWIYLIISIPVARILSYLLVMITSYTPIKVFYGNIIISVGILIASGLLVYYVVIKEIILELLLPTLFLIIIFMSETRFFFRRVGELSYFIKLNPVIIENNIEMNNAYFNSRYFIYTMIICVVTVICFEIIYLVKYRKLYKKGMEKIVVTVVSKDISFINIPITDIKRSIKQLDISLEGSVYTLEKEKIMYEKYDYIEEMEAR